MNSKGFLFSKQFGWLVFDDDNGDGHIQTTIECPNCPNSLVDGYWHLKECPNHIIVGFCCDSCNTVWEDEHITDNRMFSFDLSAFCKKEETHV